MVVDAQACGPHGVLRGVVRTIARFAQRLLSGSRLGHVCHRTPELKSLVTPFPGRTKLACRRRFIRRFIVHGRVRPCTESVRWPRRPDKILQACVRLYSRGYLLLAKTRYSYGTTEA